MAGTPNTASPAAAEDQLSALLNAAVDAMVLIDDRGIVTRFNRAAERVFGYAAGEVVGRNVSQLMPQPYRREHDGYLERYQHTGEARIIGIGREVVAQRKDGSTFPIDLAVGEFVTAAGRCYVGILRDISERKRQEEQAEDLRARLAHVSRIGTLGEMVSGIAHEVNQPLTAIANYASACRRMMLAGQTNPGEMLSILEKIAVQAERAGQVIRGLRALAKRGDNRRQLLDCNQLVREVLRIVEFEVRGADVALDVRLAPSLTPVLADGVQIQQVVLNLIRNAMEAMGEAGSGRAVVVETGQTEPEWVTIRVSDRGPGLSAEVARRLFEPFFTTKKHGMGLGLSICQSIATAHGGELRYSQNEWGGATFALQLPAIADEEAT
jgi:two-component system, LuxR family, sensor kinase FixL